MGRGRHEDRLEPYLRVRLNPLKTQKFSSTRSVSSGNNPIPNKGLERKTCILAIGCSLVRFDRWEAHLLRNPDRAPEPEVEAPETDDE